MSTITGPAAVSCSAWSTRRGAGSAFTTGHRAAQAARACTTCRQCLSAWVRHGPATAASIPSVMPTSRYGQPGLCGSTSRSLTTVAGSGSGPTPGTSNLSSSPRASAHQGWAATVRPATKTPAPARPPPMARRTRRTGFAANRPGRVSTLVPGDGSSRSRIRPAWAAAATSCAASAPFTHRVTSHACGSSQTPAPTSSAPIQLPSTGHPGARVVGDRQASRRSTRWV